MTNNNDLSRQIQRLDEKTDRRFRTVYNKIATLDKRIDPIHEYISELKGFFRGQDSMKTPNNGSAGNNGIVISRDVWGLIIKLIGFIGVLLAIIQATQK